jgi:hypothetical protein
MEEDDDPTLNHFKLAKRKPAEALKYMDNCRNLLSLFFQLNLHLAGAIDTMLDEFTEPKEESKGKEPMESEPHTPVYSTSDYIDIDAPEPQPTPPTPRYFPSSSYGGYEGGEESGNTRRSVTPIENSTGWCFEPFMGTYSDPVRCDPEIDRDVVDQYQSFHYGMGDYQENPIVIESDSEGGKARKVAKGEYSGSGGRRGPFDMNTSEYTENVSVGEEEYSTGDAYASLNNHFMMTDFSLGSSSDSDYQPIGRPYVPDTIRRTTRSTGWTPGMYQEQNYE